MNIVLEGPDGGGKSTLARCIQTQLGYSIHASEGPIRSEVDMVGRFATFTLKKNTIFDRIAMISEPIYGPLLQRRTCNESEMRVIREFYDMKPLIIYCRPTQRHTLTNHNPNSRDTKEYLRTLQRLHPTICIKYDLWAIVARPIRYEIGDDIDRLISFLAETRDAIAV